MLRNLKLETRFNSLLLLVFICGVSISGVALSTVLQQKAQDEVASKAITLMGTMTAVRSYTSTRINPLLAPRLETETQFIPETVPAYSATEVFENFRKNEGYKNFFYKEATLNPTNLRDKADSFEAKLVERFRQEPGIKEISDFRPLLMEECFTLPDLLLLSKRVAFGAIVFQKPLLKVSWQHTEKKMVLAGNLTKLLLLKLSLFHLRKFLPVQNNLCLW